MKAIMVMFDSLNRRMLPPYGGKGVHAPNFERLAGHSVVFDTCYGGSMPCMPARRELHTGRYNFLHRSWGPLEPFDDSMPQLLKQNGVYTHLSTDHYHYWQDGGATYHNRYSSFEAFRGQEGDFWKESLKPPEIPANINPSRAYARQDWVNRGFMQKEADFPQAQTFSSGLDFIERNHDADNWFLHIETFDPHEPYFVPQKYLDMYPTDYSGPLFDWPPYQRVTQTPEQVAEVRRRNAALHSFCDANLGRVLDAMDKHNLWKDTLLIVNTDHGFLLGEHGWWAKCVQPFYDEVIHSPLFIWDPRARCGNARRSSLVQSIDLPATLLEFFNRPLPTDMQGKPLRETLGSDTPVREAALFGIHGGHVNCTDGRYVYMRGPATRDNTPLYQYTVMPTHMDRFFSTDELKTAMMAPPFSFTKGCPLMRTCKPALADQWPQERDTRLFDLQTDPGQDKPVQNPEIEKRMIGHMVRLMKENDAPAEQFERLGL